jgi:DNA-binding IscR family transcriptional regulator
LKYTRNARICQEPRERGAASATGCFAAFYRTATSHHEANLNLAPSWLSPQLPQREPPAEAVRTICRDDPPPPPRAPRKKCRRRRDRRVPEICALIERRGPVSSSEVAQALDVHASHARMVLFLLAEQGVLLRLRDYKPLLYTLPGCAIAPPEKLRKVLQYERVLALAAQLRWVDMGQVAQALGISRSNASVLMWNMKKRGQLRRAGSRGAYRYTADCP